MRLELLKNTHALKIYIYFLLLINSRNYAILPIQLISYINSRPKLDKRHCFTSFLYKQIKSIRNLSSIQNVSLSVTHEKSLFVSVPIQPAKSYCVPHLSTLEYKKQKVYIHPNKLWLPVFAVFQEILSQFEQHCPTKCRCCLKMCFLHSSEPKQVKTSK